MPEKVKNKTNLQQCISLHITLSQIIPLQNDTQALKIRFASARNDQAKNIFKKSKKKTKQTRNSAFHYVLFFQKLYLY